MDGRQKHARVYFRRDGKRVLVTSVHRNHDATLLESEGPLSLTTWDDESLGESILTALDQSGEASREVPRGMLRRPDPPTLKISGEPSPRAFDAGFIRIEVFGALEAGSACTIQGGSEKENLTISATLPSQAPSTEFARQVTRIYQICRDRKF